MKKPLCIVLWIYGEQYQGWIPVYVMALLKNYPEYDLRVYLDGKLRNDIDDVLNKICDRSKYVIIENFLGEYPYLITDMEKRAVRWLISDEELKRYEYVYIGDADIYLIKEDVSLLDQHISHMEKTKLLFSNEIRINLLDAIISYVFKRDNQFANYKKLTGLHFFKTEEYLNKVGVGQDYLKNKIKNGGSRCSNLEYCYLKRYVLTDDERVLYYLLKKSGFKLPKKSLWIHGESGKCFRPLHGPHFGTGRASQAYKEFAKIIEKNRYSTEKDYKKDFVKFVQDYNSDYILRNIINSDKYVKRIVEKTAEFFDFCMTDEIIGEK